MTEPKPPFLRDLKAGHPFFFSHGEYSDYSVDGFFIPLEDLPALRLLGIADEIVAEWKRKDAAGEWSEDTYTLFIPELIRRGLLMEITTPKVRLGGWDELRVEFRKDRER